MNLSSKNYKRFAKNMSKLSTAAQNEMHAWILANGGYQSIQFEAAIAEAYRIATKYGEA